ncbi:MAG: nucleotide exchange factor GrpE [Gammaproteobacteria bacterium RIFCSPHIGHO2_12_FULL_35_23]|nr:MAG: nucleotide exchange factor GrpE [Gammaproteobacteria bacterium RIFCSPHIGHO2_12_FULL_35_23]
MSKDKAKNPWEKREANHHTDPVSKAGESLHQGDELMEEALEQEIEDLAGAEKASKNEQVVQQKLAEAQDQLIRAHAEIENVRRRAEHDVARAHKFGVERLVQELVPILDSLEQALQNKSDNNAVIEGVELTYKLFLDVLTKFNVKQLNPLKEKFNPQLHEAISMQEDKAVEPNTVLAVVQKGYTLNERLIRPARVVVSR